MEAETSASSCKTTCYRSTEDHHVETFLLLELKGGKEKVKEISFICYFCFFLLCFCYFFLSYTDMWNIMDLWLLNINMFVVCLVQWSSYGPQHLAVAW
jgi:hypothetical protein